MYWLFQGKRESKEIRDIFSDEMLTNEIKQHNHALTF